MDYGRFLSRSWQITWRYKFLWLWSGLAVLGTGGGRVSGVLLHLFIPTDWRNPDFVLAEVEATLATSTLLLERMGSVLLWGVLLLFLLLIVGWLLFALAEGVIIRAVLDAEDERPVTATHALRGGWPLLGRFVAIDAAVFFPLFLLLLLMLLLLGGALISSIIVGTRQQTTGGFLLPLGVGGLCLLPLLLLLAPLGLLTTVFRGLAFRDTAVYQTGVRDTIRHTWTLTRAHLGPLLIVTGLLWGVKTLFNVALSMVTLPVFTFLLPLVTLPRAFVLVVSLVAAILLLLLQAILHTFTAVTWTMAYLSVIRNP
ncbi:MAG: hypothetical protein KC443_12595 [Anaerolineales bacterium]|nr:hypothetical protein [Anaerolineales bacterium]